MFNLRKTLPLLVSILGCAAWAAPCEAQLPYITTEGLDDPNVEVRLEKSKVIAGFQQLTKAPFELSEDADRRFAKTLRTDSSLEVRRNVAQGMGKVEFGKEVEAALLACVADADPELQFRAAVSYAVRTFNFENPDPDDVARVLLAAAASSDAERRREAADALDNMRVSEAIQPEVLRALKTSDARVRQALLSVCGWMAAGDKRVGGEAARDAAPILLAATRDPDAKTRALALRALAVVAPKHPETFPALIRSLDEKDYDVLRAGAQMLADFPERAGEAIEPLAALLERDGRFNASVFRTLRIYGPAAAPIVPRLSALAERDSKLGGGGGLDVAQTILAIAPDSPAAQAIIRAALRGADASRRWKAAAACEGLGKGAKPFIPELIALLEVTDPNQNVMEIYKACGALEELGPEAASAVPALRTRALRSDRSGDSALEALRVIDPAAAAEVAKQKPAAKAEPK